jgi:hypothetical protein
MLGWEIIVTRQDNTASKAGINEGTLLATWMAGLGGTKWLDHLVANGQATDLGGDGYPLRWLVSAGVLRSVLAKGLPKATNPMVIGDDYVMPRGWTQVKVFKQELLASLEPDEVLKVEAWDQS